MGTLSLPVQQELQEGLKKKNESGEKKLYQKTLLVFQAGWAGSPSLRPRQEAARLELTALLMTPLSFYF